MKNNKNIDKVFDFIVEFKEKNGFIPSVREIGSALGFSSTSTIAYYLDLLEEKGKIKRSGNKNRAIEVVTPSFVKSYDNFIDVPLVGQIAAGQPILAIENLEDNFKMPTNLFKGEDLFMLKIKGNSMINIGINNGDYVVIKKQNYAENGDVVAAMWNDEATVKRFYREKNHIRLQPENDNMKPIIIEDCEIVGKVVGVIRTM